MNTTSDARDSTRRSLLSLSQLPLDVNDGDEDRPTVRGHRKVERTLTPMSTPSISLESGLTDPMTSGIPTTSRGITKRDARAAIVQKRKDYLIGVALLMAVVVMWTGSNFITNDLLTTGFDKPFFVTYSNTSAFALYLLPFALDRIDARVRGKDAELPKWRRGGWWEKLGFNGARPSHLAEGEGRGHYSSVPATDPTEAVSSGRDSLRQSFTSYTDRQFPRLFDHESADRELSGSMSEASLAPLTTHETAWLAGQFTILWFAANWSLNTALGYTSVASGTVLSSVSGFFTLGLGAMFGVETFALGKLGAVVVSVLGVSLVSFADSSVSPLDPPSTSPVSSPPSSAPLNAPLGDLLALLSAFCYAVYVTLLKHRIRREERVSMPLFFGFVGAFTILGMWPVGMLLHLTGVERWQWPEGSKEWGAVGINMAITFVSDMCYLIAMLKTTPLAVTIGLSLTIPLAVVGDIFRGRHVGGIQGDFGALLVLLSFVFVGLADNAWSPSAEPYSASASATETEREEGRRYESEEDSGQRRIVISDASTPSDVDVGDWRSRPLPKRAYGALVGGGLEGGDGRGG